ncbi:MAG: MFS transporter [Rickettsiaceae bacterium]|nr:MFS transporter [Rickettsiaceae bacterium]
MILSSKICAKFSTRFIEIFCYGVISSIPFSVLYTAIIVWMKEIGAPLAIISTLAAARVPYGFKYLWAPIIDSANIPFLWTLGKRKSWMMLISMINLFLLISYYLISLNHDADSSYQDIYTQIYIISMLLGFFGASFDIVFDAYRIDSISADEQGYAVSCVVFGYRAGVLIPSVGMMYFSSFYGWGPSFLLPSIIILLGICYIPFLEEDKSSQKSTRSFFENFAHSFINPLKDFLHRKNIIWIFLGIILYKVGGVLLGFLSTPFYLEIGYTKIQIASIVKTLGIPSSIIGSFIGGYIVSKYGNLRGLVICGLIQAISHLIYLWLNHAPKTELSLFITITIENIGSGAGTAAEVAYLSYLCKKTYSATQYALLSSFAGLLNSIISVKSGDFVSYFGWDVFFLVIVLASLPSLIIFVCLDQFSRT